MTNLRLMGAVVLSLLLATPAIAMHRGYHRHHGYVHSWLPHFGSTRGAFAYDRGYSPGNVYNDFDRRNTFN